LNGKETYFYWNQVVQGNETFCSLKSEDSQDVINDETLKKFNISCYTDFQFSKNEKYALFKLDVEKVIFFFSIHSKIYRHSALSKFKYFDLKNPTELKEITPLKQNFASFCPNDENKLVYVEKNDM
jgi:hypothetical protein